MKNRNYKYALFAIILLSILLRFWRLNTIPPGLTPDETALGYNAYSILKTGRDEYGKLFPVIFKSFGDYKPGLYVYATVPFVALLGLNEWSVRLPSAIAGVAAVFLLYLIVNKLIQNKVDSNNPLPILSAFMLAINPWHINFSRGAWEVNLALTLILSGVYLFLLGIHKHKYYLLSAVFFSFSLLTYQGAKLSAPLAAIPLIVIYRNNIISQFKKEKIWILVSIAIAILIALPIVFSFIYGETGRLKVFSIFSYPRPDGYLEGFLRQGGETKQSLSYFLYHSESVNFMRGILGRLYNHYSARFLFFEGDWPNPRHGSPNHGMLQMFDLVFLPIGFLYIFRQRWSQIVVVALSFLILFPFPSALSRDAVSAVRSYNMLIPLVIISSLGLFYCIEQIKKIGSLSVKYITTASIFLMIFLSGAYYLDSYFVHLPSHNARYWEYGTKETVLYVNSIRSSYENIIFQQSYAQPYIYFLFYTKYDPKKYQKYSKLKNYLGPDVGLVENLDNIHFDFFSWPVRKEDSTLIVGTPIVITSFNVNDYDLLKEIKEPDGNVVYKILKSK